MLKLFESIETFSVYLTILSRLLKRAGLAWPEMGRRVSSFLISTCEELGIPYAFHAAYTVSPSLVEHLLSMGLVA